jgi:hypothetical protein
MLTRLNWNTYEVVRAEGVRIQVQVGTATRGIQDCRIHEPHRAERKRVGAAVYSLSRRGWLDLSRSSHVLQFHA